MAVGAYAIEKDYSHYVSYAAKTVYAVVGTATKGPIGVPTLCTSTQDLVNKFGPLCVGCYALYAGQYFLSQSSKLYFVRAAHETPAGSAYMEGEAAEASVKVPGLDIEGDSVEDAIVFSVNDKGTYYNNFNLLVSRVTEDTVIEEETLDNNTVIKKATITTTISDYQGLSTPTITTRRALDGEVSATKVSYTFVLKNSTGSTVELLERVSLEDLKVGYTKGLLKVLSINNTTAATELTPGVYKLGGGDDGIGEINDADYIRAGNTLAAESVDMNLLAVPGVSSYPVIEAMISLAETRGDTLFLVDPPQGLDRDGVVKWHNGVDEYSDHPMLNSSYAALYYDWVIIYDSINGVKVEVPPSVVVGATIAYSDRTTELWYAPAGLSRGIIRGVTEASTVLSRNDVAHLYEGNNAINALYSDSQVGLAIWGQKTLFREETAINRINVRRLMNYLKKVISAACDYLTFEPNDRVTWNSFEMKVMPVLTSLKNRRGLYDFQLIKGESIITDQDIDNYKMPCMVLIRPTKAAEEIPIHFVITSTGADFNTVLESSGVVVD